MSKSSIILSHASPAITIKALSVQNLGVLHALELFFAVHVRSCSCLCRVSSRNYSKGGGGAIKDFTRFFGGGGGGGGTSTHA